MLKVWNVCLIVATFSLALLGTFLVRSGVLQSIHAFGDSTVGPYFLGLIGVVLVGSTALIISRLDDLRSAKRIDSLASREAIFLVNNLLLVGALRGDLLGHLLPADLRALHRRPSPRWRRPGSTATRPRSRSCWSSSPASGRCSPGGGSAGRLGAARVRRAGDRGAVVVLGLALFTDAGQQALGAGPVRLRGFRPDRAGAGVLARRRGAPRRSPAARCRRRWSRSSPATAAATAATSSTPAIAVLLVGVAASSSFQTNRDLRSTRAERRRRRLQVTYVRPTVDVDKLAFTAGAVERVGRTARPSRCTRPGASTGRPGRRTPARSPATSTAKRTARSACKAGLAPRLLDRDPADDRRRAARRQAPPTRASRRASAAPRERRRSAKRSRG